MSKPQVWTWEPNSNSGKPLFALAQKGVDFDFHYIDMTDFEHHSPEYLARNPAGTLPTMEHDGKIFTESTPMVEYIDRTWPDQGPQLVPDDPMARYWMRYWGRVLAANAGSLSVIGWSNFIGPMTRAKSPEERERILARAPKDRRIIWRTAMNASFTEDQLNNARAAVGRAVQMMEDRLKENAFLTGPTYTVGDVDCFANFYSLTMSVSEHANPRNAPRFCDWLLRIYNMPGTMDAFALARTLGTRAFECKRALEEGRDPVPVTYQDYLKTKPQTVNA